MSLLRPTFGSALFVLSLTLCALAAALYLRILVKHREYWRRTSSPTLAGWVLFGRYLDVGDSVTIRMAQILRAGTAIFFVGAVLDLLITTIR